MDPSIGSLIGLIGNLGTSSAAVIVCWFFLDFLKRRGVDEARRCEEQYRRYEDLVARQSDVIKDNAQALREFRGGLSYCSHRPDHAEEKP